MLRKFSLKLIKIIHAYLVFNRRTRVIANHLIQLLPKNSTVLDIGCGDGSISYLIMQERADVKIQGIEINKRSHCYIPVTRYDGLRLPYSQNSYDVIMLNDTVHHSNSPFALLKEASRVTKKYLVVKDHLAQNRFDHVVLSIMDWIGNHPLNVVLKYKYFTIAEWKSLWNQLHLEVDTYIPHLGLYPLPLSLIFEGSKHFIARLKKVGIHHQ